MDDTDASRWTQVAPPPVSSSPPAGIDTGLALARSTQLPPNFAWNGVPIASSTETSDQYVQYTVPRTLPRVPSSSTSPIIPSLDSPQWISEYKSAQLSLHDAIDTMKRLVNKEPAAGISNGATTVAPINFAWNKEGECEVIASCNISFNRSSFSSRNIRVCTAVSHILNHKG